MRRRLAHRSLLAAGVATVALAAGAAAGTGPTIDPDRPCYREGTRVRLSGTGFSPGAPVSFLLDGDPLGTATSDPEGAIVTSFDAPIVRGLTRNLRLVARDERDTSRTATSRVKVSKLSVRITPRAGGAPNRRVRFAARGFTRERHLYVHYLPPGDRPVRTIRLGRLRGGCGTLDRRARLIPFERPRSGRWLLRFDSRARYSSRTRPQVRLAVTVRRPPRDG